MTVQEKTIFSKGQPRPALVLTPPRLSIRARVIWAAVAILCLGCAVLLFATSSGSFEVVIFCGIFGVLSSLFALFKVTYEVIQGDEVRLRLSSGPLSFVGHRIPLHSQFPSFVDRNEQNEVVIFTNQGKANEMAIGPFPSEDEAIAVLDKFQYQDLSEDRHREERSARAEQEVMGLTAGINPGLLRLFQATLAGVVMLPGIMSSEMETAILSTACLLAALIFTELWMISPTNIEETSSDFQFVKFTRRYRYFWNDTYMMNPLEPEEVSYLGRSFNHKVHIPILLFLFGSSTLLIKAPSRIKSDPSPAPIKVPRSPQEEENFRRGVEALEMGKKLLDAKEKEEKESNPPQPPSS